MKMILLDLMIYMVELILNNYILNQININLVTINNI